MASISLVNKIKNITNKINEISVANNNNYVFSINSQGDSMQKILIGEFCDFYDSNITINISSTTHVVNYGILVIAIQNYKILQCKMYLDNDNYLINKVYIENTSNKTIKIYYSSDSWSKSIFDVKTCRVYNIKNKGTIVNSIPSTANIKPSK